ncbi:Transcriptional regulator, TetR family [Sulfitobacter sp. THAF37]|uniref:TetR/AcrR family transcriptional regulator n=1 Tax=Sulfitobacter sp. THAF37 TaxID=2587855 RepID=UPI001268AA92|nr:TetR/AcrR family transcriptional regulator [Sulfitobacter sp. THAF37]QFT57817.1 Transcriptional regulator, TetR family [Sulfitobacter sp. THAF37]
MPTTRLNSDNWIAAGFDALRQAGPQALAAEPLARRLGTTKGSFYWHFKDVPAYHAELLSRWRQDALAQLETLTLQDGPADRRLRDFGRAMLTDRSEPSLRLWAQTLPEVGRALAHVDAARLSYLESLLRQLGLGNPDFARALLASLVGLPQVAAPEPDSAGAAFDVLVDTVLALQ